MSSGDGAALRRRGVGDRLARGGEHRAAAGGVNVQHPDAEPRRRGASLRDGVRDVVELEIEKDVEAALDHPAHGLGPGDDEELLADLERARRRIEPVGERQRVHRVGEVERDDDFRISITHIPRDYAYPSGVSVRRGE